MADKPPSRTAIPVRPSWDESQRLAALHRYGILDTPREPQFDDVARLAADIFEAPVALVSLVAEGRQWFKAEVGAGIDEMPLETSICAHAILQPGVFVVPDTTKDERFACNPLVTGEPGLRFYAGALLQTPDGLPIGTVCVLDTRPRPEGITERQRLTLEVLARQVMSQLELREAVKQRDAEVVRAKAGEDRLRLVLDSAVNGVYGVDHDGFTTFCNAAFLRMLGFSREEDAVGLKLHDLIHHSHADGSRYDIADCPLYKAAQAGIEAHVEEELFFRLDGSPFPVEYWVRPFVRGGEPQGAVCTFVDLTQAKSREAALRASEARLRLSVEAGEMGEWELDLATDTSIRAPRHDQIFGYDEPIEDWGFERFIRHVVAEDRERVETAFARAAESGSGWHFECRIRRASDGELRWIAAHSAAEVDRDGRASRLFGLVQDITEQRRAEALLRELNEDLERQVAERTAERDRTWQLSRDMLSVWDLDGVLRRANPAWTAILGYRTDEVEGRRGAELRHPEDGDSGGKALAQLVRGDTIANFENRFRHKDGSWRWISWTAVPEEGLIYAVGRDITDEKKRKQALLLYENIVQSHRSPVGAFDRNYRLIAFNQAHCDEFHRVFGRRIAVGEALPDLFPADQKPVIRELMDRALAGEIFTVLEELGDPELVKPCWEISYFPLRDEAGKIIGAFHHANDISARLRSEAELRQAQEALRQSQKMEAVGQLTGGIAHDFNNLLQGVSGCLDLIRRKPDDAARVLRWAEAGLQAAERGAKLTGQLLAFSRAQKLQLQPLVVSDVIAGTRDLLARTLGPMIGLGLDLDDARVPVCSDSTQLEMAVLNLAINARDVMPNGGTLSISTKPVQIQKDPELEPGEYLELAVTDTGAGMSPDVAARAFDPFFTTKELGKGTGLGLSQVYGIARQAGGTARIESCPGKGTTVRLYLRRTEAEVGQGMAADGGETVPGGSSATVVVIDDDSDVRRFLIDSLDSLGFRTIEAKDGAEGLAVLDECEPDLLLVDFAMPGMTGADVARAARVKRPGLPILFVSGYADTAAIEDAAGGEAMILRKPFRVNELQAMVVQSLQG